jgi:hypothetical protein
MSLNVVRPDDFMSVLLEKQEFWLVTPGSELVLRSVVVSSYHCQSVKHAFCQQSVLSDEI